MRLREWAHDLLEFCYPSACAACESPCADDGAPLCDTCDAALCDLQRAPSCIFCAMPLGHHDAPCPYCLGEGIRPFERILRLGVFRDPLKKLIHHVKYHNRWTLAEYLTDRLFECPEVNRLLDNADRIIAVPLHPWRHMSRGYNQAQVVAKRLARRSKRKLVHPVIRVRNTETQTHQHSKQDRMQNLREAFGLTSLDSIRDRHVVVVDDVMTTGATLQSIARTLNEAEPASVSAIVLAIADPRRRDFQAI